MPNWKKVVTSGSNAVLNHITASGNISASGTIVANKIESDNLFSRAGDANTGIQLSSDTVTIEGNNVDVATFNTSRIILNRPITASGNISASGTITGNSLVGTVGTATQGTIDIHSLSGYVANEHLDWTTDLGATNIHSGNYTDTTYSVGDGGLTTNDFTNDDHSKLNAIEASADVTDATNVTAAGALMDSELSEIATVKALTGAGISGSFTAASASFSTRVTANDAKLTANTTNVTSAGALMDSELTNLAAVKAINQSLVSGATPTFTTTNFTDASNKRFMTDAQETKLDSVASSANNYVLPTNLAGDDIDIDTGALTGATVISDLDINITTNTSGLVTDANASVATRTLTAANLSLGNVTNESKATMFTSPTFTGTLTTPLSKIGWRNLDWQGNIDGNNPAYAQGDVIYHTSSIVTVAGSIYSMATDGTLALADADAVSTSSTLLVVALSTNANAGLLLRGTVVLRISPGADPGQPIYLSTTAGQAQAAAPSGTGDVVRVLGYQLTPNGEGDQVNVCYFNPDNTWVELT
jgi:hypothetical protein